MSMTRLAASCRTIVHTLSALLILIAAAGCGSAPPLGSEDASSAADALYTAVTSRRMELVDAVEEKLNKLHAEQQVSPAAMSALQAIIEQARAGQWQAAAEELDQLIRNQPA
jgi:predicted small lipoprotein YifL